MIPLVAYRWVALALTVIIWSVTVPVQAQLRVVSVPHERVAANEVITQFISWEGDTPIHGISAYLPDDWTLVSVQLPDEAGRFLPDVSLPFEQESGSWRVVGEGLIIKRGQVLRLTFRIGRAVSSDVLFMPLKKQEDGWAENPANAAASRWDVVDPDSRASNRALSLNGESDSAPTLKPGAGMPSSSDSWTLSWWMKSSGLDQVILSTWTGFETDPYPVESVLDASGHVTVFTGRDGQHFAMRSVFPVSDGTWHHVAVVHDGSRQKMRLHVDGAAQDSLQFASAETRRAGFSAMRLGYRLEETRPELSFPLRGALDEVALYEDALDAGQLLAVRDQMVREESPAVWSLSFDDPVQAQRLLEASIAPTLVPSILSVRKAASDLKVLRVPDGIELSFQAGDEAVERYRIETSDDGRVFRTVAAIEWGPSRPGRVKWVDRTASGAVLYYRVTAIYPDGPGTTSPVIKVGSGTDEPMGRVHLEGNFPNPFNPTTTIRYEVFEPEHVRVSIWDLSGQMISQPVDASHQPGQYEVGFDAGTLPSGTYFVRLESLSGIQTHQMILMK